MDEQDERNFSSQEEQIRFFGDQILAVLHHLYQQEYPDFQHKPPMQIHLEYSVESLDDNPARPLDEEVIRGIEQYIQDTIDSWYEPPILH